MTDDLAAPTEPDSETPDLDEVPEREIVCADGTVIKVYSYAPLIPIDAVTEHPDNPNQGDDALVEAMIRRLGFRGEIEVRAQTRETVAGNTRLRAMRRIGAPVIPATVRPMSDREARERLIGDNRSRDVALYDDRQMAVLLGAMRSDDDGLLGTGFGDADVDRLLAALDTEVRHSEGNQTATERHDNFLGSEIRQVILVMGIPDFERVVAILSVCRERLDVESNSEAIVRLLDRWAAQEGVEVVPKPVPPESGGAPLPTQETAPEGVSEALPPIEPGDNAEREHPGTGEPMEGVEVPLGESAVLTQT